MSKTIIIWESNWVDEMDISGYVIVTEQEAKDYKKLLKNKKDSFTIYVGTNEEIEYESYQDLLDELVFTKLSDEDVDIIERCVGLEFGFTEFYEQIEEDEDDED